MNKFFVVALLYLFAGSCLAADTAYLKSLQQEAISKDLANHPVWQRLLHYKRGISGGVSSQVDAENFFLAKDGKKDPIAELNATLAGFFSDTVDQFDRPAKCRFIARYSWLRGELQFDQAQMPEQSCKDYDNLMRLFQPIGITLVFPSSDPRSPNSMFGHSLLRIDREGQTDSTRMLAFAANFAAQIQNKGDPLYALKGLFGFYPGKFTLTPYYAKLREYGQMERRDLWEYPIRLNPAQLKMTIEHLYELLSAYYDYYFFTENCAYHVLSALEPAFPGHDLTNQLHLWATPVDVIRILQKEQLLEAPYFHPSHRRMLEAMENRLTNTDRKLSLQIAAQPSELKNFLPSSYSMNRRAMILDLADEYRRYRRFAQTELDPLSVTASEQTILLARAKLSVPSEKPIVPRPNEPGDGHEASRLDLRWGQQADEGYMAMSWRAVYHDLTDPVLGYSPHTALTIFDTEIRRLDQSWKLQRLEILNILSLSPQSEFFRDKSWQVNMGWRRDTVHSDEKQVWLRGGAGYSGFFWERKQQVWALMNIEWAIETPRLKRHALSPGLEFGWHRDSASQRQASNLRLRFQAPLQNGFKGKELDLLFSHTISVGKRQALTFSWARQKHSQEWQTDWNIGLRFYH